MYYNIKIKYDDSELSLESDNIVVTQREMDIYFAHFFDVSEEYSRRINKMLSKNIDTHANSKAVSKVKHKEKDEFDVISPIRIEPIEFKQETISEVLSNAQDKAEMISESISFQNTKTEIKSFAVSSDLSFKNSNEEYEGIHEKIHGAVKLNDDTIPKAPIINLLPDVNVPSFEQAPNLTMVPTPNMADIECLASVSPYEYDTSIPVYDFDTYKKNDNQITQIFTQAPYVTPSSTTEKKETNIDFSEPDFSKFLANYSVFDIHDEFMICAYYIKNILRQDAFTIKYINSKLFSATGKIADTALVDELINKRFVNIIDITDIKLYSITQEGEKYFLDRFRAI